MLKKVAILGVLVFWCGACGADVDLTGLQFQPPEGQRPAESDETDTSDEAIPCAYYYHCLLEELAEDGDPGYCLTAVEPAETFLVGAVENCRKNVCGKQSETPGSASFDPEAFMECVFSKCWQASGECAVGHGDGTCRDFAEAYKVLDDEEEDCHEAALELCMFDELYTVKESHATAVDLLLDCIFNQYKKGQPWESCVSKCNLAVD